MNRPSRWMVKLSVMALMVGVATVSVGGLYLAWVLFRENRAGRG